MFRASTAASAVGAEIIASGGDVWFGYRTTAGGSATFTSVVQATPVWLKLVRNGSSFAGYYSTNDSTWTQLGSTVTLSNMPNAALVGLEVSSDVQGTSGTGTFTNVSIGTVPAVPTSLAATAFSSTQINLTWTSASTNQTGFQVQRATNSTFTQNLKTFTTTGPDAFSYNDTGLTSGTTYYYRVEALNGIGASSYSTSANTGTFPVATPTNLTATEISTTQINLSWTAPTGTIAGYYVYRGTSSGAESTTALNSTLIPAGTTTYSDGSAAPPSPMTPYFYTVKAVNSSGGASAPSLEATVITQSINPPTGVSATVVSSTQINLAWTAPTGAMAGSLLGYNIFRGTTSGGESTTPLNSSTVSTTSFSDTTALPGTTYYYTIQAVSSYGNSFSSKEVSAQTGLFTTNADIGGPTPPGSSTYNGTTYTVSGGGADMYGATQQFQYDYLTYTSSSVAIIAELDSQTDTSLYAKAGVMIRASNSSTADFADVVQQPLSGSPQLYFQYNISGTPYQFQTNPVTDPVWIKLVDSSDNFSGYYSTNGTTWTQIGSTEAVTSIPSTPLVGLAVCSNDQGTLSTATFTNVSIQADPQAIVAQQAGTASNGFAGYGGFAFTPNTGITVTQLGIWTNGIVGARTVELVDATTGTVLGSVSIALTGQIGQYVYGQLATPINLVAGQTYYLLAQVAASDEIYADASVTPNANLNIDGSVFQSATGNPKMRHVGDFSFGLVNIEFFG